MLSEVVSFLRSMNRYWQTVRESWQISGLEEMAKHAVREGVGGWGGGKSVPCPFVLQRFKKAPAVGAFNISSTNGHFTVVHEVGGV